MINSMLAAIILISTLLFGAVEVWSGSLILSLVFAAGLAWVLKGEAEARPALLSIALAFCGYIALQLVPLPAQVIRIISPATASARDFYSISGSSFMTLSFNPYSTVSELLRAAAFFLVFFISSAVFKDRIKLSGMLTVLLIFGFCLAVFAIVQKATSNDKIYWFRELTAGGNPFGPFVNRNHFAGFVGMLIPLGLGYSLTRQQREKKIFFGFLTVITSVSLFFSLSRGGIISFLAAMALFCLLVVMSRVQQKKLWAVGFFLVVVTAYLAYLGIDPLLERFARTDVNNEQRIIVWKATLDVFRDFWLTGTGLGTYIDIFPLYSPIPQFSIYDHAHNDYLEYMAETGAFGIILLLAFAVMLIYPFFRADFQGRRGLLRIGVVSSVFAILVHSVFDFNLHILSNLLLFAVVLGMMSALSDEEGHQAEGLGLGAKGSSLSSAGRHGSRQADEHDSPDTDVEDWEKEIKQ